MGFDRARQLLPEGLQRLAGLERRAVLRAVEELDAELVLEIAHELADRGL